MTPDAGSLPLLRALHERVFGVPEVCAVLDAAFGELAAELRGRRDPPHATRVIPIDLFTGGLPAELAGAVRLCRAFLLRRGSRMAAPEVHRNSIQRLVSYRGSGWIHQERAEVPHGGGHGPAPGPGPVHGPGLVHGSGLVRGPGVLTGQALRSPDAADPFAATLDRSWDVVPAGVWHFPEAGDDEDWATVTFHGAAEEEIVDKLWEGE